VPADARMLPRCAGVRSRSRCRLIVDATAKGLLPYSRAMFTCADGTGGVPAAGLAAAAGDAAPAVLIGWLTRSRPLPGGELFTP
jgi:hypothetical protein